MTAYRYHALQANGDATHGHIEADSAKQVRQQLRDKQLIPVSVEAIAARDKSKQKSSSYHKTLSAQQLALITRQLATLLQAGTPIAEALATLAGQFANTAAHSLILQVRSHMLEGHSLAAALSNHPKQFPALYIASVRAGEQSGQLSMILQGLADHLEQQHELRQQVKHALIYPTVMLMVSIAIIAFLLTYVVPNIVGVFQSNQQQLPQLTHILLTTSAMLQHYGLYMLITIGLCYFCAQRALQYPTIRQRWHQSLLRIPVINSLIISVNTSRFTRTLGLLSSSGLSIIDALQLSKQLINNLVIKRSVAQAINQVREGSALNQALKHSGYFSQMSLHLLASGEHSGRLGEMASQAAQQQERDLSQKIKTAMALLEPAIILLMGAVVLFIVLAILLPIFAMNQMIG